MNTSQTKIAICSIGDNPESNVSDRFARCNKYAIYNSETLKFTFIDNEAINEMSGAGSKAARIMSKLGIETLLVPEVGPKAFVALEAFDIKVFKYTNKEKTVKDTLTDYFENKLTIVKDHTTKGKH